MKTKAFNIINNNRQVLSNFSYLAILEIFVLIAPLITYPYLVRVLGSDLYGWVITGQITASYASILIDFGFRRVSAKHVASSREDKEQLSRIVSTVVVLRLLLWFVAFLIYISIVLHVPSYRSKWLLFVFSYGLTSASALLPDFYFQGIEQMKYITYVNILIRIVFVGATFMVICKPCQYIYVPLLWSIGYLLGGIYSLFIVFKRHNIRFIRPRIQDYRFHLKETTPIFLSDIMLNVKDKFSYNLMGIMLGMSDVVIYDIGTKIVNLLSKPAMIFSSAIFPSMSRNPDVKKTKRIMLLLVILSMIMVGIVYIFLSQIVHFFIDEKINLLPIRIYLLVPLFTGLSFYIPSGVFVVFGRNKYVLYSTIFSAASYLLMLSFMWINGYLQTITDFILITVVSYITETLFRLFLSRKIFIDQKMIKSDL